ncbi:EamA family transporter [Halomonas heilongjiangensis]|uniref:EamA family transporter n=1 Tax=Halomonas heilongjiangensis TaxID=1387883 RepID=A0A2N7TGN1_9GAMM|nr:DMT family transporter [Halomonas heilongjiangensis]PMR67340.1 EamA family transporter [Halomonas heilongjiangensis]PXX88116.1 EamA family transporter [Halomonas heilongjiangensis]
MSLSPAAAAVVQPFPRHLAILLMLGLATLFAANHVAARLAFDEGTGLLVAILARSSVALVVLVGLVLIKRRRIALPPGTRRWQLAVGVLVAIQSLCLYSAVARIPVVVALLLMNTFPLQLALLTWALGGPRPTARAVVIMATILVGLVVVLDIPTWLASPEAMGPDWAVGVGFGLVAATAFACALWITQHRLAAVSNSVRSLLTMTIVFGIMALAGVSGLVPGGMALPASPTGWVGLLSLALLYGVGFAILFVSLPRLDMARNAPVMNVEPVASLVLGYLVLGQMLSAGQLVGGAIVLGGILLLSISRRG